MRIAVAAGAEQGGRGVFARAICGVGEGFQRLVDGRVDVLACASEGGVEGAADGGADEVVVHGDGGLLLDELMGVGLGNVDAFTGGAAEERLFQFDEHGAYSRGSTDGRCEHGPFDHLRAAPPDGLASVSGGDP